MPYTKQNLQTLNNLSEDEVNQTLSAAALECDQESYTDEEIQSGFDIIRSYFNSGQVSDYGAASELFKQHQVDQQSEVEMQAKTKKSTKGKKSGEANANDIERSDHLSVVELIALASAQCKTRISLTEVIQILDICELPDKDEYTSPEGDRFLEACELLKKQNKSYEEVATHFGTIKPEFDLKADMQEILSMVGSAAIATDDDLLGVLKQLAAKRGHAISAMYERMLLTQVAQQLKERQQKRQLFSDFGERLEAYVEGKSSIPRWEIVPAFSDQPTLKSLPQSSDNS